jgi:hypothetical protein
MSEKRRRLPRNFEMEPSKIEGFRNIEHEKSKTALAVKRVGAQQEVLLF